MKFRSDKKMASKNEITSIEVKVLHKTVLPNLSMLLKHITSFNSAVAQK